MGSRRFNCNLNPVDGGMNPLLPMIVGVIENLEETTNSEIQRQIELDMNKKLSEADVLRALENGIKLGVLELKREFKVCREFSRRNFRRIKHMKTPLFMLKKFESSSSIMDPRSKKLMEYVNYQRDQRRRKLNMKGMKYGKTSNDDKSYISEYLCPKCQESVEKERTGRCYSESSIPELDRQPIGKKWESGNSTSTFSTNQSVQRDQLSHSADGSFSEQSDMERDEEGAGDADSNADGDRNNANDCNDDDDDDDEEEYDKSNSPLRSRLLVRKNPLETEPPYYDILT